MSLPVPIFGEVRAVLAGKAGSQRKAPLRILNCHARSINAPELPIGAKSRHIALGRAKTANRATQTARTKLLSRPHWLGQIGRKRRSAAAQAMAFDLGGV